MSAVNWAPPKAPAETTERRGHSGLFGVLVGGTIPLIPAAWGAQDPSMGFLTIGGLIGVPIGAVLGGRHGSKVRALGGGGVVSLVATMAVQAVLIGDLVIGGLMAVGGLSAGGLGVLVGLLAVVVGLLIFGLPALVLTVPCAAVWVLVMRLLPEGLVGDGQRPIVRRSRRVAATVLIVGIASLGGVPFALAATDGRYCPDLEGRRVDGMAWAPDGRRLVVTASDADWEASRAVIAEIDSDLHSVRIVTPLRDPVDSLVVAPDGTIWWEGWVNGSAVLWSVRAEATPIRHGAVDEGDLWWIEGGLAVDGWERGLVRINPRESSSLRRGTIAVPGAGLIGQPVSASVDGSTVGWIEFGPYDEVAQTEQASIVVVRDGHRSELALPEWTVEAIVSSDGRWVVHRADDGWAATPIEGGSSVPLVGSDWTNPALMGNQVAIVREGFRDGQLCFQPFDELAR